MKVRTTLKAVVAVLAFPTASIAQDIYTEGSVTLTSEYVSQGFELSDGPALQAYAEVSYGGLYFATFGTTGDQALLGADSGVDLYLGYAGQVGPVYYDVGVASYFYQNASFATDYEELYATIGFSVTDAIYTSVYYGYANEFDQHDVALSVDYYTPVEGLILSGTYGDVRTNFGDWNYYSVGASYALNDAVTVDATYYDADTDVPFFGLTEGIAVVSLSYAF